MLTQLGLVAAVGVAPGCADTINQVLELDQQYATDNATSSDGSGTTSDAPSTSATTGSDSDGWSSDGPSGSDSDSDSGDTEGPGDAPPEIVDFRVGGSVSPGVFSTPGPVHVYAEVDDDDDTPPTVVFFESRDGGPWIEVASASAAPYGYTVELTGADFSNGERRVRAVARELPDGPDDDEAGPIAFTVAMPSGGTQWWSVTRGSVPGDSEALDIAIDGAGGVYVTGHTSQPGGGTAIWTAHYSASGQLQWERELQEQDKEQAIGRGVAVDGDGHVFVVGSVQQLDQQLSYGPPALFAARFDEHGEILWQGEGVDFALRAGHDVALDETGDLVLTGYRHVSDQKHDVFLMIIDGQSGDKRFSLQFDGGADRRDHGEGIALLDDQSAVIVGWLSDADDRARAFARKYDLAGEGKELLWKWTSSANLDGEQDRALAVAGLPDGSLLVAGSRYTEPSGSPRRVAFDLLPDGSPGDFSLDVWNEFGPEAMHGVAANHLGRFALAGVESHPDGTHMAWTQYYLGKESYAWIKPDANNGIGGLEISDEARAVAVGLYGTVAVAGYVTDEDDPDRHHILVRTYYP